MIISRLLFLLTALIFFPAFAFAQHEDLQLLSDEEFLEYLQHRQTIQSQTFSPVVEEGPVDRCGFFIATEIARRFDGMNFQNREILRKILAPVQRDTSIISPSGRFRIHFDLTGKDAPALLQGDSVRIPGTAVECAKAVAEIFDHTYEVEVLQLGYTAPPFERGYNEYNVYLMDFGTSTYGHIKQVDIVQSQTAMPTWTSYIEMDNDFLGFYSKGLNGARVTAAHEFHHMIQIGSYGWWTSDAFFYEMTSTYLEDYVYDDVNDYYQYLKSFFEQPDWSLYKWRGYETVPWLKMLERKYSPLPLRKTWEEMRKQAPLQSMDHVLKSFQSDLAGEYCSFNRWNYYTSTRASEAKSDRYDEAEMYPKVRISSTVNLVDNSATFSGSLTPLSTQYVRAYRGADTVAFSVGNTDVFAAFGKEFTQTSFILEVKTEGYDSDFHPIGNGWAYRFIPGTANILCLNVYAKDAIPDIGITSAFPNPYSPGRDGIIRFPVDRKARETKASLYIFSPSMSLIAKSENIDIRSEVTFGRYVAWDGNSMEGEVAPSGVYFYTINYGGTTITGKFALIMR